MKKLDKIKYKKIFKAVIYLKLVLTIYLIVGFLIVPGIENVNAETIHGAHRGASLDYEENTIDAFEKALKETKYRFIEFDIQYSKDGEIVVFHENNKWRISKTSADITDLTYDELNSEFEFEIPKYEDVMDIIGGKKPIDIEIKSHGNLIQDMKLVDFVVQDCKNRGIESQIMISSPSNDIITYIEENYPEIRTGKVYWITIQSLIPIAYICDDIYETPADYVLLHGYNIHNYETLIECKPEDKGLIFWYFTDEVYIVNDGDDCEFWGNC